MLAFPQGSGESGGLAEVIMAAAELAAVVGLPGWKAKRDSAAAQPFPHRGHGGLEGTRRSFDSLLASVLN